MTEGKSGQQVDGNDRESDPLGEPPEQSEHEEDGPEFDEQDSDMRSRGLRCRHDLHRESTVRGSVRRTGCSVEDVRDLIDRGLRAHGYDEITRQQHEIRCRGRHRRTLAEHRHDGRASTRASLRIAERTAGIRRVGRHGQLLDEQPLGLALKYGKPKCQCWRAQYLCDRVRFVLGQRNGRRGALPLLVVEDQVPQAVSPGHNADAVSVSQIDLLAYTNAGQHPVGDGDIHLVQTTGMTSVGTLTWTSAIEPLVALPVAAALAGWPPANQIRAAPIDPALADTAGFCARYDVPLEQSANCVVIAGRRAGDTSYAACVILATTRADVNGVVRRLLGARKASFAPMDDAVELTGMEYGGITPIGLPSGWPVLVDPAVLEPDSVVIGSGLRRSKLLLPPKLLTELPGADVVEGLAS